MHKRPIKLLLWNVNWASPDDERGRRITEIFEGQAPDVTCFTEVCKGLLPKNGHAILADADYGYQSPSERRKVALWSRQPWTQVESIGSDKMPSGRAITGVTGGVRFVGVCIPWKDAHVRTGRKDRQPWDEHLSFLRGIRPLLIRLCNELEPVCLLGDFNQRIPRKQQPEEVAQALTSVLEERFQVATAGSTYGVGGQLIDHIATFGKIVCRLDSIMSKNCPDGVILSDHVGIVANLMRTENIRITLA